MQVVKIHPPLQVCKNRKNSLVCAKKRAKSLHIKISVFFGISYQIQCPVIIQNVGRVLSNWKLKCPRCSTSVIRTKKLLPGPWIKLDFLRKSGRSPLQTKKSNSSIRLLSLNTWILPFRAVVTNCEKKRDKLLFWDELPICWMRFVFHYMHFVSVLNVQLLCVDHFLHEFVQGSVDRVLDVLRQEVHDLGRGYGQKAVDRADQVRLPKGGNWTLSDQAFPKFGALKSTDQRVLCSLETAIDGLWSSDISFLQWVICWPPDVLRMMIPN